jgi:hypothetical protein
MFWRTKPPFEVHIEHDPADIQAALDALDRHLASPDANVLEDALAGRPMRAKIVMFAAIGLIAFAWMAGAGSLVPILALALLLVTWLAWLLDRRVRPRNELDTPHETLRAVLSAMRQGRAGYVLASLCPTARECKAAPPSFGLPTRARFVMNDVGSVRSWLGTFATPWPGAHRFVAFARVYRHLGPADARVARVHVELLFEALPWTWTLAGVMLTTFWIGGAWVLGLLVGLYFAIAARRRVAVTRTLIKGTNGRWYVLTADLFDDAKG